GAWGAARDLRLAAGGGSLPGDVNRVGARSSVGRGDDADVARRVVERAGLVSHGDPGGEHRGNAASAGPAPLHRIDDHLAAGGRQPLALVQSAEQLDHVARRGAVTDVDADGGIDLTIVRSEEHTSELQS